MSSEPNSDEIPVNVISDNETELDDSVEESKSSEPEFEDVSKLLELEKQKSSEYEQKLKLVLADFQNLTRKTQSDIENGVNSKINEFALDFLKIYDDFVRAKEVFSDSKINSEGLDSILKNMDSL